jgi:hypothetical protein
MAATPNERELADSPIFVDLVDIYRGCYTFP